MIRSGTGLETMPDISDMEGRVGVLDVHDIYLLFEGFGRDCIWDLCQAHTPCPPMVLQSSRELLLGGAYPVTGGLSGN